MARQKRKVRVKASEAKITTLGPAEDVTAAPQAKPAKTKRSDTLPEGSNLAGPAWGEQL